MKVISLLALVGSAAAFAPAQQGRTSTSVSAFEKEVGVTAPVSVFPAIALASFMINNTVSHTPFTTIAPFKNLETL